jgi:NhaP-type Na+/H+ or K+/H+ antiporter
VQLIFESIAFLLIGLQLPGVIRQLKGMPAWGVIWCSVAVFITVIVVRIVWI